MKIFEIDNVREKLRKIGGIIFILSAISFILIISESFEIDLKLASVFFITAFIGLAINIAGS